LSVSKGENVTYGKGQGVIMTKDGGEEADYTLLLIGNITEEGKPAFCVAAVSSNTPSTRKLAFS
jgi:hypothetical protein